MRINKYLAEKGYATRRSADALIRAKRVRVNGVLAHIGQDILESDTVTVAASDTGPQEFMYLAFHKPGGIASVGDATEAGIAERIAAVYGIEGVFPVGRLDKDTEGLVLLTNDGRVTRALTSPNSRHEREYLVVVDKRMHGALYKKLEAGMRIERSTTRASRVVGISPTSFKITITEGKKHQIKRMCAALGFQVKKSVRLRIENIMLGKTKPGQYRIIRGAELAKFLELLGIREK